MSMPLDLNGPGLAPPPGVMPQLDSPPNGNHIVAPVIIVCIVLSSILFLLRIYSKYITKEFHWRDLVTGLAFAFYWPYVYYNWRLTYTSGGYLVHQWDLRLGELSDYFYVTFVATVFYTLVVAAVKIGILLEFTAIFVPIGTRNYFFWISHITIGIILIWNIIGFILTNVNCSPYSGNWDPLAPGRFCRFSIAQLSVGSAVVNLVIDLVPLLLPQSIIWGLNASWRRKLGVSLVFLVGLLGIASALVRLVYTIKFSQSSDVSYSFSIVGICSMSEITCGVIILCVPFTPKALTALTQTRAFNSLVSWTSTLRKSQNSKSGGSSLPAGSGLRARQRDAYQEFDKQPSDVVHLTDRSGSTDPAAITCETQILVNEEYNTYPQDTNNYYLTKLPSRP